MTAAKERSDSAAPRTGRVPVILQQSATECGAACLAMILSYHGRKASIAECRECIGVGRDGVKASTIVQVARRFGLRTRSYSGEPEHMSSLPLPAILFWEFKHYIVLERWSPARIDVVDPAFGRRRLTPEEFDRGFTGVVMTFEPGVHFANRSGTDLGTWRTYLAYMLGVPGTRSVLVQVLWASLLLQTLGLVFPAATKVIVDYIVPGQLVDMMSILAIGLAIVVVAQLVTSYLRYALLIYLQSRLDSQMMLGFFEHMLSLPLSFFQGRGTGDLLLRLNSNSIIREVLTNQTIAIILDGGLVVVYLAILFAKAPLFAAIVFGIGVVQAMLPLLLGPRVRQLLQEDLKAESASQGYLVEALGGIATLKSCGAEPQAIDRWSNLFFVHINTSIRRNHLSAIINVSTSTLGLLAPLTLLWAGGVFVLRGELSLGTMLAFNALGVSVLRPLASMVSVVQQIQFGAAHFARLFDVLDASPEQPEQRAAPSRALSGRVALSGVSFRYNEHSPYVIEGVSVDIEPGQKVAIVGPTGSGKTTLGLLLLGLHVPTEGEIHYDGVPLSQLDLRSVRCQFGVVLQDAALFSGSIRHNITFNRPDASMEEVIRAASLAAVHDDILRMPMGYETRISERSMSLSGGQAQRIALARALMTDPGILLLDEATSHLDVLTESQIERNLSQLPCTRIVIAHRLSTIRDADCILVMDGGRIVERGTHAALVESGGFYASLISRQRDGSGEPRQQGEPSDSPRTIVSGALLGNRIQSNGNTQKQGERTCRSRTSYVHGRMRSSGRS